MKKLIAIWMTVLLILCVIGCQNTDDPETQMKKAYLKQYNVGAGVKAEELSLDSYGTYNGCTVAFIHGPFGYPAVLTSETVGPCVFQYSDTNKFVVFKDGECKSLSNAYKDGWLDDAALQQLLAKHMENKPYLYAEE